MILIGFGIGFLSCFLIWLFVSMCRIGSLSDEWMDAAFQRHIAEQEGCAQTADSLLHGEESTDAGR